MTIEQARLIAEDKGLDLVEVAPNAKPPVVKIIDYGKFKYEQQKKLNEAKKKQVTVQLKEIQFRPNIDIGDLNTKLKRAEKFFLAAIKLRWSCSLEVVKWPIKTKVLRNSVELSAK